jgi:hypothetical protein
MTSNVLQQNKVRKVRHFKFQEMMPFSYWKTQGRLQSRKGQNGTFEYLRKWSCDDRAMGEGEVTLIN